MTPAEKQIRADLAFALRKMADEATGLFPAGYRNTWPKSLADLQHRWGNLQMIVAELLAQLGELGEEDAA